MMNRFITRKQVFIFALILVFIYLITDLNARVSDMTRLVNQRDQMRTEVMSLKQTEMVMQTQVAFATSDAAVRPWAYQSGHKALPGDYIIIPMSPENYTPAAPTSVAATPQKVENWQVWWALFFGD